MIMTSRKRPMFPPAAGSSPHPFPTGGPTASNIEQFGGDDLSGRSPRAIFPILHGCRHRDGFNIFGYVCMHVCTYVRVWRLTRCAAAVSTKRRRWGPCWKRILRVQCCCVANSGPSTVAGNPHRYRVVGRAARTTRAARALTLHQRHLISSSEPWDQLWTRSMYGAC